MKIIIIGNGSSVLKYDNGEFIDSCDRVVRMNGFKIKGFESYVGTKLDIYSCWDGRVDLHDLDFFKKFNELWYMEYSDNSKLKLIREHLKVITLGEGNDWSTGWNTILTAIKYYDEVYVTGFDQFFKSGWYWDSTTTKEIARAAAPGNICSSENVDSVDLTADDTTHPLLVEKLEMLKLLKNKTICRIDDKKM